MSLTQRTQYNPPQTYTVPLSPATLTHFRSPQEAKSDPAFLPPAKLKIKIAPHVNITSPPFPQGVYGRKVEQVADIVVGMGGRVVVNVVVDAEVLAGCEVEEGRDVDDIEEGSKLTLRNKEKLGLTRIVTSVSGNTISLSPAIGDTSGVSALDVLLVTGKPTATLAIIDLSLSWEAIEPVPEEAKEGDSDTSSNPDPPSQQQRDDDLKLRDEPLDLLECDARPIAAITDPVKMRRADPLWWLSKQLEGAMHKIIKVHMIRRFPLIFDGALIKYARTLHPHRSLTSSFSRFLTLSQKHSRPASTLTSSALLTLAQSQEAHVLAHARAAASVPHRAKGVGKGKGRKKRKVDRESQGSSGSQGQDVGQAQSAQLYPSRLDGAVAQREDPVQQRVDAHLEAVAQQMQEEEGEGVDMETRVLDRLLRQGMGSVGRAKWEKGRMGMGRLAVHRIKLVGLDDQSTSLYSANTTPAVIDNPDSEVAAEDDPLADFLLDMDDLHVYADHHCGATHYSDNVGKVAEEAGRSCEDVECEGEEEEEEDDMALLDWNDEFEPEVEHAHDLENLGLDFDLDLDLDLDIDLDTGFDESQVQAQTCEPPSNLFNRATEEYAGLSAPQLAELGEEFVLGSQDLVSDSTCDAPNGEDAQVLPGFSYSCAPSLAAGEETGSETGEVMLDNV